MGGERSTYGVHTGFWWGKVREREQLEEPGTDRRIILKWIFRNGPKELLVFNWAPHLVGECSQDMEGTGKVKYPGADQN